jgi:hypothetical protein
MANKPISSSPLFGSASPQQVTEIQQEIRDFTAEAVRTREAAQELLRRTGVPSEKEASEKRES